MEVSDATPEFYGDTVLAWPKTPAVRTFAYWVAATVISLGTQANMGLRLVETFKQAGLNPDPDVLGSLMISSGVAAVADALRSLLPTIVAQGIATENEIDIDTFADRLRTETNDLVIVAQPNIGAWATKPLSTLEPEVRS
jgi:hypothetical protein